MACEESLGPVELREIERFRRALELEEGFAFHVIVADNRHTLDAALAEVGVEPLMVRPSRPKDFTAETHATEILASLDRALTESGGKKPVLLDMTTASRREERSWIIVLRRLNELRNGIERRFPAPLLLAVTPYGEGVLGREAPDFWSRRGSGMRLRDRRPRFELGWPIEAEEYDDKILASHSQLPASDDPVTTTLREIRAGAALITDGKGEEAVANVEAALGRFRREHPTLRRAQAEASLEASEVFGAAGRREAAREAAAEALRAYRELVDTQGREFLPNLAEALSRSAAAHQSLGAGAKARELYEEAVAVRREALGEQHPETLRTINELARALQSQGRAADAFELHQKVLEIRRRELGEEHADTLQSKNNLALTLLVLGRLAEARDLNEETLEAYRRTFGEKHPDTLRSMNNLVWVLREQGEQQAAHDLMVRVVEGYQRLFGDEHPRTKEARENLNIFFQEKS